VRTVVTLTTLIVVATGARAGAAPAASAAATTDVVVNAETSLRIRAGAAAKGSAGAREPMAQLAEKIRSAVVHVRGVLPPSNGDKARAGARVPQTFSVGSGFLIDGSGDIVTNEHVVRGAQDLRVRLYDGREFSVCVTGQDEQADIALLKIVAQPPAALPHLPLGDSDKAHAGQSVLAIGSPFGFSHSVTAGIVSATERVVESEGERSENGDAPPYSFYIQTDASINVGNSGGPLVDSDGTVIGVNAAFWGGSQPASGVGFAIPINVVKLLLPQLRDKGSAPRSYLGVESQPVSPALAAGLGLPNGRGALVAGIDAGGAAEAAGLQVGDVVTSFGSHPLATRDDFRIFAELTVPGTKVKVGLLRLGKPIERDVVTRPAPKSNPSRHIEDCRTAPVETVFSIGLEVRALPPARAAALPDKRGINVVRVTGGAARDANIEVGDIILRVGQQPVSTPEEFARRVGEWKRDAPLPLLVQTRTRSFWTALLPR
jgi:serine protease Do